MIKTIWLDLKSPENRPFADQGEPFETQGEQECLCYLSGGEFAEGVTEASDDALLAENDHGIEEGRRDGLPDNGNANGVDKQSCFHAASFGDGASGVITGVVIPLRKCG